MSKEPGEISLAVLFSAENQAYTQVGQINLALESAIRADERAKVDGEIERLKSENIRLRETLGEILHAVCRAARAALEEEKP